MFNEIDWVTGIVPVLVATLPAVAAAVVAARSAVRVRRLQDEASYVRDLENRLADKKYAVYEPLISELGRLLTPAGSADFDTPDRQAEFAELVAGFVTWISIYGSDGAVARYHKFMQASFHEAPGKIAMRCYAELILAARKDMGMPETDVSLLDLMGMRITDIHDPEYRDVFTMPEDELYRELGWVAPWETAQKDSSSGGRRGILSRRRGGTSGVT